MHKIAQKVGPHGHALSNMKGYFMFM